MAKSKEAPVFDPSEIFGEAFKTVQVENLTALKPLDILSFAKDILKETLYPSQSIMMKFFYAGTRYNEDLRITEDEIEAIKGWDIEQTWVLYGEHAKLNVLDEHLNSKKPEDFFCDLMLILGRRSGKSFISALIAVYEAYKLFILKDPQKFYGIDSDIYIINTARTGDQAKAVIFQQIKKFIYRCPFFDGRVKAKSESGVNTLHICTDHDVEFNEKIEKQGGKALEGSIVMRSGNSNSEALLGHSAICVIYDEMAHFVNTAGKSSSEETYVGLSPSTFTFKPFGDGRNIVISSPNKAEGWFYKHFRNSQVIPSMLVFQIPSWNANPTFTRTMAHSEFEKDPDRASAEFGAKFRRTAGNAYFPINKVEEAMKKRENWYQQEKGVPGNEYYLHIDTAQNSDNWAIMIGHPERRFNDEISAYQQYIIEDFSQFFKPPVAGYLDPDVIMDDHILPLFKKFRIVSVTFDRMFSLEQRKKLAERGIHHREVSFSGRCKNEIYDTMRDYFLNGRIELCNDDDELQGELINITVDYNRANPKIDKNPDSEYPNDDLSDCLGGIIHSIMLGSTGKTRLPRSVLVNMGRNNRMR